MIFLKKGIKKPPLFTQSRKNFRFIEGRKAMVIIKTQNRQNELNTAAVLCLYYTHHCHFARNCQNYP